MPVSYTHLDVYKRLVQEMRVKARWEALDEESIQIVYAKTCGKMYLAPVFANGDTRKQLLARSIYPVSYTHLDVYKRQILNLPNE